MGSRAGVDCRTPRRFLFDLSFKIVSNAGNTLSVGTRYHGPLLRQGR